VGSPDSRDMGTVSLFIVPGTQTKHGGSDYTSSQEKEARRIRQKGMAPNKEDTVIPPGDCKASGCSVTRTGQFVNTLDLPYAACFVMERKRGAEKSD
jgi:hypothetical protein